MLSPLNMQSDAARRFPDLFRAYDTRISEFNATMATEAKIAVPLLVGGWVVLFFVAGNAEHFDPAFRSTGIFLLVASIGYWWSRDYRFQSEEKKILRGLAFDVSHLSDLAANADHEEKSNDPFFRYDPEIATGRGC